MTRANALAVTVRVAWMVLGGVIGASVGFGGFRSLPRNADGFGTMLAQGFFLWSAFVGLCAGMALGALIGGASDALLRRLGAKPPVAMGLASIVTVMMLAQIRGRVLAQYPGLHTRAGESQRKDSSRRLTIVTDSSARPRLTQNTCAAPQPTHERELRLWREECR